MNTRGRSPKPWQRAFVTIAAIVVGGFMLIFGVWSLLFPRSFDAFIDFPPYNQHLLHDVGAFQIGIGVSVLLSLMCLTASASRSSPSSSLGQFIRSITRSTGIWAATLPINGGS